MEKRVGRQKDAAPDFWKVDAFLTFTVHLTHTSSVKATAPSIVINQFCFITSLRENTFSTPGNAKEYIPFPLIEQSLTQRTKSYLIWVFKY